MWDVVSLLFLTSSATERLIFDSEGTVYNGSNSTYRPRRPLQIPQTKSKARFVDQWHQLWAYCILDYFEVWGYAADSFTKTSALIFLKNQISITKWVSHSIFSRLQIGNIFQPYLELKTLPSFEIINFHLCGHISLKNICFSNNSCQLSI